MNERHPSIVPSRTASAHPPHPLNSRRARRAAQTREKLFRAALRLFIQRGFAATTVEQITDAADVGKGTFFNYFPSKEHVLAAFGDLQIGKLQALVAAARESRLTAREAFVRLPVVMAEEPGRSPLLLRAMLTAMLTSDAVRKIVTGKMALGRERLSELILLAQREGLFRHDITPRAAALLLQQTVFGAMLFWSFHPTEKLSRRMAKAVEQFVAGMEARRR
jgi:AcrR family transcriptional regulator